MAYASNIDRKARLSFDPKSPQTLLGSPRWPKGAHQHPKGAKGRLERSQEEPVGAQGPKGTHQHPKGAKGRPESSQGKQNAFKGEQHMTKYMT